jgi:hypothetical protein
MEKIIIDLEAKTDKALKEIEKLNKTLIDTGKESKKSLSSIDESAKKAAKSTNLLQKGFKGAGLALKGLGIGIVVKLVDRLSEAFSGNQKIVDAVNVAFETVSIVGKQLIDVFSDVFGKVSDATGGFDALKKVLGGALSIAVNTVVLAFQGIVLGVQKAQLAWEDSFFGDGDPKELKRLNLAIIETETNLGNTAERIKNGGKDIADNFTEAVGEVGSLASGVAKAVTETIEKVDIKQATSDAKRLVKSQKNFELLALQQQRLVEKYDLQAERLRQVRDDESKSIEERIEANKELEAVLLKQNEAEKATVQARIDTLLQEQRLKGESVKLSNEIYELQTEMLAIDAKVAGFESEQQTNKNSLLKEEVDLKNELNLIGKTETEKEIAEATSEYEAKKLLIEQQITDETERKSYLELLEQEHLTNLQTIKTEADEVEKERQDKLLQEKIDRATKERELEKQKIKDKQMVVDAISQFADAETGIGKALLIAKQGLALQETIMDLKRITFKGTQAIGDAGVSTAQNVAESSKIGFPQNIITIAGAIAQGVGIVRSVKKAVSKTKAKASGGASPVSSIPTPSKPPASSIPPAFNVVGASGTNQLAEAIGGQSKEPVKAYVVANDVSTAQSMDRNIIEGASI